MEHIISPVDRTSRVFREKNHGLNLTNGFFLYLAAQEVISRPKMMSGAMPITIMSGLVCWLGLAVTPQPLTAEDTAEGQEDLLPSSVISI
ncbi:hypothetical protein E2C01_005680 [Portunus trituberculatus]|uniref:Uncharacterized protein n=1 Tax=Portunus trituberculatus TaxID=210409 RepID=A0A5B7CZT3_PORTR|nr:hypothetical protein [Portunus trituberculatus]